MLKIARATRQLHKHVYVLDRLQSKQLHVAGNQYSHIAGNQYSTITHTPHVQRCLTGAIFRHPVKCSNIRQFHRTILLSKKFDPTMYVEVNVYDPSGNFVTVCEMLVLKKFSQKFHHRFTFEEMESVNLSQAVNTTDVQVKQDAKKYQIKEKSGQKTEKGEKSRKVLQFRKNTEEDVKLQKMVEFLINHETVKVTYKEGKPLGKLNDVINLYGVGQKTPGDPKYKEQGIIVNAKPLTVDLFARLLRDIRLHEETHIKEVLNMMKVMKAGVDEV